MQQTILIVLMIFAALATLGVLARGIFVMARGKDVSGVQSNRLMSWRIGLQAVAILLVVVIILINRNGG
jgi:hypothetical protein